MFIARAMCSTCSLQKYLELWPAALNEAGRSVLMLKNRPTITTVELHTFLLKQHYALFMRNKLQYTWRGDYCECVRPAQLPVLTWSSSSVPPGTKSTIRSPPGPRSVDYITFSMGFFDVLLTVHLSIILVITNLMHKMHTYRVWWYQMPHNTIWPPDDEHIVFETCRGV
jgi:hypothetical protein